MEKYLNKLAKPSGPNLSITKPSIFFHKYFPSSLEGFTNKGNLRLELYGESAPITVGNFIDFVEKGAYDKTIFNRVIRKPYPFIIRGGDNSLIQGESKFIDKKTGKVRYIPLEIKLKTLHLRLCLCNSIITY